jgi:hypothetical protein
MLHKGENERIQNLFHLVLSRVKLTLYIQVVTPKTDGIINVIMSFHTGILLGGSKRTICFIVFLLSIISNILYVFFNQSDHRKSSHRRSLDVIQDQRLLSPSIFGHTHITAGKCDFRKILFLRMPKSRSAGWSHSGSLGFLAFPSI